VTNNALMVFQVYKKAAMKIAAYEADRGIEPHHSLVGKSLE